MTKYNVEIYNLTTRRVVFRETVFHEQAAARAALAAIARVKDSYNVIRESAFDISPRGFVIGQDLHTVDAVYRISTGVA